MEDYFIPIILTNCFAIVLLLICFNWPRIGILLWAVIFMVAGIFNLYKVSVDPASYILTFGATTVSITYKYLIYLVIAPIVQPFISMIAIGQLVVACMLLLEKLYFWGIMGALVFFIMIAPLGLGAAFPMPVIAIIALLILYSKIGL